MRQKSGDRLPAALVLILCWVLTAGGQRLSASARFDKMPNVVVCYADWAQCDGKVLTGAEQGCNVIVWFAVNIRRNATSGQPEILGGPAPDCVARVAQNLSDSNLSTLHLVSIGGWDQQHPYASAPAADVWEAFKYWNEKVVARPDTGFKGYDGIDWDVEGADSPADPANLMSVALLDLIGDVSKMAKKEGYVVSMAPMESYLDPSTSEFNRSLLQRYPEWNHLAPDFAYHGRNTLAYLLARHGKWWSVEKSVDAGAGTYVKKEKRTFDMISIQFYETYSHANYAIVHESVNASVYFAQVVSRLTKGWLVDFSTDDDPGVSRLGMQSVDVHSKQLVLGVANAWAGVGDPVKALYLTPFQLREVYETLLLLSLPPRGFMFWSLKFEGQAPGNSTTPLYLAAALNAILRVRPPSSWENSVSTGR